MAIYLRGYCIKSDLEQQPWHLLLCVLRHLTQNPHMTEAGLDKRGNMIIERQSMSTLGVLTTLEDEMVVSPKKESPVAIIVLTGGP